MSDHFRLTEARMARIAPFFPKSRGRPRADDRRVLSGIIRVLQRGLQWRDAPARRRPAKTLYNRYVRWSRARVFARIFSELAIGGGGPEIMMLPSRGLRANRCRAADPTRLHAHRTAASLAVKKGAKDSSGAPKAG